MFHEPFHLKQGPFLRDVIFYIAASFWAFALYYNGEVNLKSSIGFLALYVVYIVGVIISPSISRLINNVYSRPYEDYEQLDDTTEVTEAVENSINSTDSSADIVIGSSELSWTRSEPQLVQNRFNLLLKGINPIDLADWRQTTWYWRIFMVVKVPITFILKLTIPVVDTERPLHNWCPTLSACHCITVPLFILYAPRIDIVEANSGLIFIVCLVFTTIPAVLIFVCANPNHRPRCHNIIAYVGFISSTLWIYLIANEVVNVLKTLGVVFAIDDAILGLTVLAWGNSIGDLVANFSVARSGSRVMAISACFGGPLLNLLVGMGTSFTLACAQQQSSIKLKYDGTVAILSGFLFASLCSSMIAMVILRFQTSRPYGVYLLILYLVFTVVAVLSALKMIA
ncbi:hypothetical protein CHUAL_013837 [Chamberlinius hualienensis]